MIVEIIRHSVRFVLLVLLQTMIMNHVQWSGYVNPYVYILFILLLPVDLPKTLLLLLGLAEGLAIDMFSDTGGLHAAATVALCFARPGILRLLAPRDGYDEDMQLSPYTLGLKWFVTYLLLATTLHHLILFYLEVFRFNEFFITLFKTIINVAVTVLLMLLIQYLFGRPAKRNERING